MTHANGRQWPPALRLEDDSPSEGEVILVVKVRKAFSAYHTVDFRLRPLADQWVM